MSQACEIEEALGKPHGELSWDMKLWWTHCETLVALAMAYRLTRREEFREWFMRVHEWKIGKRR